MMLKFFQYGNRLYVVNIALIGTSAKWHTMRSDGVMNM